MEKLGKHDKEIMVAAVISRWRQYNEPISEAPPSALDVAHSEKLRAYMAEASPQESLEGQQKRAHIILTITELFREWVRSVCLAKGLPAEVANNAGGQIYTSGSYRLGLNEVGMDIDTICVAPKHVTRADFFESLQPILEDHDSVENLVGVATAAVPIITFDFDGINIDLLFAALPLDSIPETFDINDDHVLSGVDPSTEKSLNGPRVTNLFEHLVPHFDNFKALVRCVRLWAKRRGLYSNKMGYLGGINCSILAARICQHYPNAAPSLLLERFFYILRDWKWPTPMQIAPQYDAGLGFEIWDPGWKRYEVRLQPPPLPPPPRSPPAPPPPQIPIAPSPAS